MKPRNKHERKILSLSEGILPFSDDQKAFARSKFKAKFAVSNRRAYCLNCNHKFAVPKGKTTTCEGCKEKIKISPYYSAPYEVDYRYMLVLEVVEGIQLCRYMQTKRILHKTNKPRYEQYEVSRRFITENGKQTSVSKVQGAGYQSADSWTGDLQIRDINKGYIYPQDTYPKRQVIADIKRNGYKSSCWDYCPHSFFSKLLVEPMFETLLKTKQYGLMQRFGRERQQIVRHWKSIKTAIKNNYKPSYEDAIDWFDYLDFLILRGADVTSRKNVCVDSLTESHDIEERRHRRRLAKQKTKEQLANIEAANIDYKERFSSFFDLRFELDGIVVEPIKNVLRFKEIGDEHGHCLFTGEYYKKKHFLILEATKDGVLMESAEISLLTHSLRQCRGYDNKKSKHHKAIKKLIISNLNKISKITKTL